jgi:hypothetical protein
MSHSELATAFRVPIKNVHKRIRRTRQMFEKKGGFIESYLGVGNKTRDELIKNHTTTFAKTLVGADKLVLVQDGTYIYCQKSMHHSFAKMLYCPHKHRHLVKLIVCTTTSGLFVDIFGPYLSDSKNSDALIFERELTAQLTDFGKLRSLMQHGDVWILDRGYRGAQKIVPETEVRMPAFEQEGEQLEALAANQTRNVTKLRWVVEAANCRLKQFKFLARVVTNMQLRHVRSYARIVAAICNRFRPPLAQNKPEDNLIAERMLARQHLSNELKSRCVPGGDLHRRTANRWEPIESCHVPGFPLLTESQIREHITFGCYQITQAENYILEHLDENGEFEMHRALLGHDVDDTIVQVRYKSRHTSSEYRSYVQIDAGQRLPWDRVVAWYCSCSSGARTVGCCAHVASTIWWIGGARHRGLKPRFNLWFNILDAAMRKGALVNGRSQPVYINPPPRFPDADLSTDDDDEVAQYRQREQMIRFGHHLDSEDEDPSWIPTQVSNSNDIQNSQQQIDCPFPTRTAQLVVAIETIRRSCKRDDNEDNDECESVSSDESQTVDERNSHIRNSVRDVSMNVRIESSIAEFVRVKKLTKGEASKVSDILSTLQNLIFWSQDVHLGSIFRMEARLHHFKPFVEASSCVGKWFDTTIIDASLQYICSNSFSSAAVTAVFWQERFAFQNDVSRIWNAIDITKQYIFIPLNADNESTNFTPTLSDIRLAMVPWQLSD